MKTLNHVLVAATAAFTLNVALATTPSNNTALLHSPRYLEEHPELLRMQSLGRVSQAVPLAKLTRNIALANSPRFREEHPELRWVQPALDRSVAQNASESDRFAKLTENRALTHSPRFLEEHPELLRSKGIAEIAHLK